METSNQKRLKKKSELKSGDSPFPTVEGNVRKLKMFMKIYRYRNHIANNSVEGEEKHIKVECNTKLVCLVSPAPQHRS